MPQDRMSVSSLLRTRAPSSAEADPTNGNGPRFTLSVVSTSDGFSSSDMREVLLMDGIAVRSSQSRVWGLPGAVLLAPGSLGDQYSVALARRAPSLRAASLAQAMRGT